MDRRLSLFELLDRWEARGQPLEITELGRELERLELREEDLSDAIAFDEATYRRCSVRRTPHFEALVLCWKSGQGSPIHDHHGSGCAVRVISGRATETHYARTPCGLLVPERSCRLTPGRVTVGRDGAVHQLANLERPGSDLVTLHVYSPPPGRWRYYRVDETTLARHDALIPARDRPSAVHLNPTTPGARRADPARSRSMPITQVGIAGRSIAIIGGGFSGTMVAYHLMQAPETPAISVRLFEKGPRFARGLAYSTDCLRHLLNVPAGMMSALPDRPSHFLDWLTARDPEAHSATFAPRQVYGDYLEDCLAEARAASGDRLELHHDEVVDILPGEGTPAPMRIVTAGGEEYRADRMVLSFGHPPAQDPINGMADRIAGYVADPWAPGLFDDIATDDDLFLVGNGLTAVDLFLESRARGHRGAVYAMSRHGFRPFGHRPVTQRPHFAIVAGRPTARSLLRSVRREALVCLDQGGDWRSVVDSLRPVTPDLWRSMDPEERARFVRHLAPRWDVHRHRVAPAIEQTLREAEQAGRLVVLAGRIEAISTHRDGVAVRYRRRHASSCEVRVVRKVINCTGPGRDIRRSPSPLLTALFRRGLARPGELSLGLDVCDDGRVLDASGRPQDRVIALGPILKDAFWETTAVRELRSQAKAVATALQSTET